MINRSELNHGKTGNQSKVADVQARFGLALRCLHSFEDCPHTVAASFCCDEDAGVENQSHAERSRGLRPLMIFLRSAATSESIVGS